MIRISGVDIPVEKRLDIALQYIYGIGPTNVAKVLEMAKLDGARRAKTLSDEEAAKVAKVIEKNFTVEGDLRQLVATNIKRLKEINSYRGSRHTHALPSRGQRTKSNARTRRGKRTTVGALKKDDRIKQDAVAKTAPAPAAKK